MEESLPIVSLMERRRGDERKGLKKRRMKEYRRQRGARCEGKEKVQPWRKRRKERERLFEQPFVGLMEGWRRGSGRGMKGEGRKGLLSK